MIDHASRTDASPTVASAPASLDRVLGVVVVVALVGAAAGAVAWAATVQLRTRYVPSFPEAEGHLLSASALRSRQLVDRVDGALAVARICCLLVVVGGTVVLARTRGSWHRSMGRLVAGLVLAFAALALAVAGAVSQDLLRWDQVALRAVTVGSEVSGYTAAEDAATVRFVLVGGVEISPSTYRQTRLAHEAALVAVPVALVGGAWFLRPEPRRSRRRS